MQYFVHVDGQTVRVEIDNGCVRVDGNPVQVELATDGPLPVRSVRLAGRSLRVVPNRAGRGDWTLDIEGRTSRAEVLDAGQEAIRKARKEAAVDTGPRALRAPMPGLIVRVEVEVGQVVNEGDGVVIVEAMKMENELRAERTARVRAILGEEGASVEKDQVLVEFEAVEEQADD